MKKAAIYAQALLEASQNKSEEEMNQYFDTFIAFLKSKSEYKMLPLIVREFTSLVEKTNKGTGTTLIVHEKSKADDFIKELESMGDTFDVSNIEIIEDKNIVGGFIAKNSTSMLDRSYKKGLVEMYKSLVK